MLPHVILHNAVSLDGRIQGFPPDLAVYYGLAAGFAEDATLAGSGTILAAPAETETPQEPAESEIDPGAKDSRPLLVVPDSRGKVRNWGYWLRQPYWRAGVALCSRRTPDEYLAYLEKTGVARIIAGDDHVDLHAALKELHDRFGVETIRVDSGGTLNAALLRAGLVSEISLLVHPQLVGGAAPRTIFDPSDQSGPADPIVLELVHLEEMAGGLVWLRYSVAGESMPERR